MADNGTEKSKTEALLASITRRQERLLDELDQLNERVEKTLADWGGASNA